MFQAPLHWERYDSMKQNKKRGFILICAPLRETEGKICADFIIILKSDAVVEFLSNKQKVMFRNLTSFPLQPLILSYCYHVRTFKRLQSKM